MYTKSERRAKLINLGNCYQIREIDEKSFEHPSYAGTLRQCLTVVNINKLKLIKLPGPVVSSNNNWRWWLHENAKVLTEFGLWEKYDVVTH